MYLFSDDEFRVGAWEMFLSQLTSFTGAVRSHLLEKMVGMNGKVGPNPRLVSIEYTFKRDG